MCSGSSLRAGFRSKRPASATVVVTGRHVEQLQTAGRYQAGSVVVAPRIPVYRFSLVQESGQWRIDNIFVGNKPAKPNLLLMSQADFERYYQPRNLYFYPAGPALEYARARPRLHPRSRSATRASRAWSGR